MCYSIMHTRDTEGKIFSEIDTYTDIFLVKAIIFRLEPPNQMDKKAKVDCRTSVSNTIAVCIPTMRYIDYFCAIIASF